MFNFLLLFQGANSPQSYAEKMPDSGAEPNRVYDSSGMEMWQMILIFFVIGFLFLKLNDSMNKTDKDKN